MLIISGNKVRNLNKPLDDFEIISKTDNHFDLLIHESLLIKGDTPCLNSQTSSIPMVSFWVCISVLLTVSVFALLGLVFHLTF